MNRIRRSSEWWTIAFLIGFTLFYYRKILFSNRFLFPWDIADFFYPYLAFVHEELRHFRLPLWDPFVMSGYPIIGDLEAQIFYPINWLFILVSPFRSLSYKLVEAQLILHFFLAGLFMYYLARDFTRNTAAGIYAGVLFMCSGAMVAHTQHLASINAMAWYPLIFLLARRGLLDRNYYYLVLTGLVFGVQILAGHWQHSVYLGLLLFLYFFYEACFGSLRARLWPHWVIGLFVIATVGAGISMVQIVPSYQLGINSVRKYLTYWDVSVGNEPRFLWTLFLPNFFGGLNGAPQWYPYDICFNYAFITVPGCLLALVGLIETARDRNYFWIGMVLLFSGLSFGNQGYFAGLVYRTPLLNLFRVMAAYFDLASFGLCLMAGVGTAALFDQSRPQWLKKYLIPGLCLLFIMLFAFGLLLQLNTRIAGWIQMLAILGMFGVAMDAMLSGKLSPKLSQLIVLSLTIFELCFWSMNQKFNCAPGDPRTFLSDEYAVGRRDSLQFLRQDKGNDFRVAALAEFQWSGNGWNVWRIPGIYGWNPMTLERYDQYMRGFSHSSNVRLPQEGPDNNLSSPLLDLLGGKYILLADTSRERQFGFHDSKFKTLHEDMGWWRIYENKTYLSKASFYSRAYMLPGEVETFGLMASSWFNPRRHLLVDKQDVRGPAANMTEPLETISFRPGDSSLTSNRQVLKDPYCAESIPMIGGWGRHGDWIRFDIPGHDQRGRYLLLARYTANSLDIPSLGLESLSRTSPWYRSALKSMPQAEAVLENEGTNLRSEPVSFPRTYGWPCHVSRTVELGEFELDPGTNKITITSKHDSTLNIYSLWLLRIPKVLAEPPSDVYLSDFASSLNRISFNARVPVDGLLLLNEIYYPGWQAEVDGKRAELFRADGVFRALFLPAGSHRIEMRFRQDHFLLGAAISILVLLSSIAYLLRSRSVI